MRSRNTPVLGAALVVALAGTLARAAELPAVKPENAGFSSERLQMLDTAMHEVVDRGALSGIVTLVARHGQVVHFDVYGKQDIAAGTPLRADTIFRIYSMTKPVTGVAMLKLYEQGKWDPSDPLARHIPEFANLQVYAGTDGTGALQLEKPKHAPTIAELMSHTAGFTYGFFGQSPVDRLYQTENPLAAPSSQAFIDRLAKIPLAYQPGEQWVYSVSVDVQGYLVEKLSGKSLAEFMRTEIFEPLDMRDTGFMVPAAKLDRVATIYSAGANGLAAQPRDPNIATLPGLQSGGGGLYSTARDYARFATMLANGGVLDGKRILAPATIDLMRANRLDDKLLDGRFGIGLQQMRKGFGYGYDVAVIYDPHAIGSTTGEGTYFWDGAAGTWFWVDPTNDVVFVGMIQRMGGPPAPGTPPLPNLQSMSRALVHAALVEP